MSNTYTQIHFHVVVAVKFREALIDLFWRDELCRYITGITKRQENKMLSIFCMPDHMHMLFGFRPAQALSDFMRVVKSESSEWVNKRGFTSSKFRWQEGFSAFSCTKNLIPVVTNYIENQEEHHRTKTLVEEHVELLEGAGISYDPKYIFTMPS